MMVTDSVLVMQLPWSPQDGERFFRKILVAFLLVLLVVAVPVSIVNLPELTRADKERLPPQLARVVLEQKEILPSPVVEKPKVETKVVDKPKEQAVQEKAKPVLPTAEKVTKPKINQVDSAETIRARNVAKQSGLLAVANEMNELTDTRDIDANIKAKVNNNKMNTNAAGYDAALIASASPTATATKVDEKKVIGELNKADLQERSAASQTTAATERFENEKSKNTQGGARTTDDVALVFNKNKTSLYSLYDRERRKNVGLKGRIVFQLTIAPSGKVTDVKIISSELNNPALEARIISRIKMFIFSPSNGGPITINYPVEFLP
ncbi:MAG TPA: AgmX/PglI C-terminal domain-containing protein [Cellvibrio sp.]|nr:AgmX/PglI C-terminal domain-containing protein [Cellvibrio sp.]